MIEVVNVTKKFGDFTAIQDLNFKVSDGSIYGLIGYNGAGKTTLLKTITGVYKPDGGEVRLDGENAFDNAKMKQHMFYVPDDIYFAPYANMEKMAKFYNGFYPDFSFDTFRRLSEVFGLDTKARINGFSKGMQRQAEIVLGISTKPDFILFDETFDGLDPVMRNFVKKLICEDVLERGASAIITSHSLRELEDICDQLALLHKGGLVLESDIENLKTSQFKIQIAFRGEYDKSKFQGIQVSHYEKSGSVANLIVSGDRDEIVQKLRAMEPILLDVLPLTLEEVFTYEMETLGYTFQIDDLLEEESEHAKS